ncbi:MAG: hypothetical protein AAGJ73_14545, partial [Pseudomonadota bacterium]
SGFRAHIACGAQQNERDYWYFLFHRCKRPSDLELRSYYCAPTFVGQVSEKFGRDWYDPDQRLGAVSADRLGAI